jgi:hypothetical protein
MRLVLLLSLQHVLLVLQRRGVMRVRSVIGGVRSSAVGTGSTVGAGPTRRG